jgi:hypothetical protein
MLIFKNRQELQSAKEANIIIREKRPDIKVVVPRPVVRTVVVVQEPVVSIDVTEPQEPKIGDIWIDLSEEEII